MSVDRTVAVTGANGYIGSHVVKILLDRGYRVRAGAREPHNTERIGHLEKMGSEYPGQLEIVSTDVLDVDDVRKLVSGCSDLIHAA
ncbi:MAG: diaminohydroxyphosphoribosylaminopyrimidine deaminase, partial [Euryarchaeota archaeon]|nr:diaminohydroxyphosphoribosylaminopyrimidine deaminase [Euryarchaeota archaeon]